MQEIIKAKEALEHSAELREQFRREAMEEQLEDKAIRMQRNEEQRQARRALEQAVKVANRQCR